MFAYQYYLYEFIKIFVSNTLSSQREIKDLSWGKKRQKMFDNWAT